MARSGWDGPWQTYAESKPIRVESGIATSKKRGEMASTWWSKRIVTMLHSYGLGGRMERGRRYARQGQIVTFGVEAGNLLAQVQGSRSTPYRVNVAMPVVTDAQWAEVEAAMRTRVLFVASLLDGLVPPELEEVFDAAGIALLPKRWSDVRATCSCPDSSNPCKHIAAVLYVFADKLDLDTWLLLSWRGRDRDQLLEHLRMPAAPLAPDEIAPWWPLVPGARLPDPADGAGSGDMSPDNPTAVLQRCGPLNVSVRGEATSDLLTPAYAVLYQPESA